jgi:signal peptidase I
MATAALPFRFSTSSLHKTRRVLSRITWILLTIFIVAVAAGAVYVRTGHAQLAPVLSGSMRPGIHEGDIAVTHQVAAKSLHTGDIIVFHPPGSSAGVTKVHRIVSISQLGNGKIAFKTKGDANEKVDPWGTVTMTGKAYQVVAVVPKLGWVINGGLRWIIVGFTALFAVVIIRWTVKYVRS